MNPTNGKQLLESLNNERRLSVRLFAQGILVGLFGGTIVVLFRLCLEQSGYILNKLYGLLPSLSPWYTILWIAVLILVARLLGALTHKYPIISGSGIPQVKAVVLSQINMKWLPTVFWKFIGGVISIGFGLSLGREGPSIQLGAAAGQGVSRIFKGSSKFEEKILITSGASAGLAAAFNAPLAGIIFSLEEIHKNFSPPVLMAAMAASISADWICRQFYGQKAVFNFENLQILPLQDYLSLLVLGAILGFAALLFNTCLIKTQDLYKKQSLIPPGMLAVVPLLLSVLVGFFYPQCLGGGNGLINMVWQESLPVTFLVILLLVKFAFHMISYGSGVPGGIFLPILVMGALMGDIYANTTLAFFNISPTFENNYIILAMAGLFAAITKAPVTGVVLVSEMTGSFNHILAISTVCITAYLVSHLIGSQAIYDQLMVRLLEKKDAKTGSGYHYKKTLLDFSVALGSKLDGKAVNEINWPDDCLLVSISRSGVKIIPDGSTILRAGDYIHILTTEEQASENFLMILNLAQHYETDETVT